MNVRVIDGDRNYLEKLDSFKIDYQKPELLKKDLIKKYNLTENEFDKLAKITKEETNYEKRGKHRKYSKYDSLWNVKKVYFLSEQFKEGKLRKCFYLKYKNQIQKIGGFIEPFSCELIHDLIIEENKNVNT